MTGHSRLRDDSGNAMVEFCILAVFLMLPLAYVIVAVFRVQDGAYAAAAASREAGRVFVTATDDAAARERAFTAARIALRDHQLPLKADQIAIACKQSPCLTPGARVEVTIDLDIALPFVPSILGGARTVHVHGEQLAVVDRYRTDAP